MIREPYKGGRCFQNFHGQQRNEARRLKGAVPRPSRCWPGQRNLFFCRRLPSAHPTLSKRPSLKAAHPHADSGRDLAPRPGTPWTPVSHAKESPHLPSTRHDARLALLAYAGRALIGRVSSERRLGAWRGQHLQPRRSGAIQNATVTTFDTTRRYWQRAERENPLF